MKPVSEPDSENRAEPEKALRIEPLEKRESRPSDRAKRDLQGNLFKGDDPLPSIALLDPPRTDNKSGFSEERLRDVSDLLVQKLADFGV
ncbi:MAG: DNA translocase FtsK, partial [Thalassolituus sp.]